MRLITSVATLIFTASASSLWGASASFQVLNGVGNISLGRSPFNHELANDPALIGHKVHEFLVTTDADILSINEVVFEGFTSFYQNPLGSQAEPPLTAFVVLFPALGADTWINTPGVTSIAGDAANPFVTSNNAWFDTSNDGPQNHFMFAQLTTPDDLPLKRFSGRVSLAGATGPEAFEFEFLIGVPEPATMTLGAAACVAMLSRRPGRRRA